MPLQTNKLLPSRKPRQARTLLHEGLHKTDPKCSKQLDIPMQWRRNLRKGVSRSILSDGNEPVRTNQLYWGLCRWEKHSGKGRLRDNCLKCSETILVDHPQALYRSTQTRHRWGRRHWNRIAVIILATDGSPGARATKKGRAEKGKNGLEVNCWHQLCPGGACRCKLQSACQKGKENNHSFQKCN